MSGESWNLFLMFGFFVVILLAAGLYCILITRNLLRAVIGIELLVKAATLLLIIIGYVTGKTALTQSFVITIIVIEVVLAAIAGGIALRVYRHNNTLDTHLLRRLRG